MYTLAEIWTQIGVRRLCWYTIFGVIAARTLSIMIEEFMGLCGHAWYTHLLCAEPCSSKNHVGSSIAMSDSAGATGGATTCTSTT